jgi:hypothetical protein
MNFWTKHGSGVPVTPPVVQGYPGQYSQPAQVVHIQAGAVQKAPAPSWQGLAVQQPGQSENDLAHHIANNGFISKPPEWVSHQPTDHCPGCGGVNYAVIGANTYGSVTTLVSKDGSVKEFQHRRCFDCGYTAAGSPRTQLGSGQGHSNAPVTGQARQPGVDHHAGAFKYGIIPGSLGQ